MRRLAFFGVALFGMGIVGAACGGGSSGSEPVDAGDPADTGTDSKPKEDAPPPCPQHCSAYLHEVRTCEDELVKICPPDEACAGNVCVDPCRAADEAQTAAGCDFFATPPDSIDTLASSCYAAVVVNTWNTETTLTVERDGSPLDVSTFAYTLTGEGESATYTPLAGGKLAEGQTAVLFLNAPTANACPAGVTAAITGSDAAIHGTGRGKAFRIRADRPVVIYTQFPYAGATSSNMTLLFPIGTFGKSYMALTGYPGSDEHAGAEPFFQIVGTTNGTKVTLRPAEDIVGGPDVDPADKYINRVYFVNEGEVLQFTQMEDLSTTIMTSDHPIGVFGGSRCMFIPSTGTTCDVGHHALYPTQALGREYVAISYRNRVDSVQEVHPWRIMGVISATELTYEPEVPPGAPTVITRGQIVEFSSPGGWVVRSQDNQHPFVLSTNMTSGAVVGETTVGDPESVILVPNNQFKQHYTFHVDPHFGDTSVVAVRMKATDGTFKDVALDCVGPLTGWTPVGSGKYEYTRVDLKKAGAVVHNCSWGKHVMQSDAPFAATVWGWDDERSVGYSVGTGLTKPIVPITER